MFKIIKVTGDSLWPDYEEGDFVIVTKIPYFLKSVKRGDVVVFRSSQFGAMVKYVDRIDHSGDKFYVVGVHPYSLDSRQLGAIPKKDIIGKVVFHVKRHSTRAID